MPTTYVEPVTGPQLAFLKKLVVERECSARDRLAVETGELTQQAATKLIGDLKRADRRGAKVETKEGYYHLDETVYHVVTSKAGRPYAKKLVISNPGSDKAKGRWEYAPGAVYKLQEMTPLTVDVAVSYGKKFGACMICGRTLTNPVSIEAGIGPICSGRL